MPGARDPAVNKSCALRCEGCCPDLGSSRPAPCSWQPGSDLQSCLRRGIPISGHSSCRHVHLPSPSQPLAPLTWGRHRSSARINYRPIIFMHKTWHRRPGEARPRSPARQLRSGQRRVKGRKGKASYKIKEVNGSLRHKKEKRFFFFNFYTLGRVFRIAVRPVAACHEKALEGSPWDHGATVSVTLDQKQAMEGPDPEAAAQP